MDITKLTPKQLQNILRLMKEKEALLAKIAAIDEQLRALSASDETHLENTTASRASRKRRSKRNTRIGKAVQAKRTANKKKSLPLKKLILDLLQTAGPEGLAVRDIAEKLGVPNNNIFSWFYTTGKKFSNIIKVGDGRFAWQVSNPSPESTPTSEPNSIPQPPAN